MPRLLVLADTSVWIDHLRRRDAKLALLLGEYQVVTHSAVIGEVACGNLGARRREILDRLQQLPRMLEATASESLLFLDRHELYGTGIGWVDVQLLASAALSGARVFTRDRRLAGAATVLEMASAG